VLIEGLFEKGKGEQTPKALSARQPQRQLRKQQERGARALFPEGTEKIADGGARRHHRNVVQKTVHPAEGWQRIGSRGWCLAPLPGCIPWGAAGSRGYRFAQTPATFWDAFGIRDPQERSAGGDRLFIHAIKHHALRPRRALHGSDARRSASKTVTSRSILALAVFESQMSRIP
jgi:hypothetical protein